MKKNNSVHKNNKPEWMEIISRYNIPDPVKSWWQIINSVGAYLILWFIMVKTIEFSYILTLVSISFGCRFYGTDIYNLPRLRARIIF